MFEDIPVDVSPMYEGERIRAANMFVELAGPKSIGAELVKVVENVEDGKILVVGPEISEMTQGMARDEYAKRDERARELSDEDVDVFYGCLMCQSFAPSHMCVVTPDRTALCGAINWFDCRAAAKIDPEGPIFEIEKGEVLDAEKGEYVNVNTAA